MTHMAENSLNTINQITNYFLENSSVYIHNSFQLFGRCSSFEHLCVRVFMHVCLCICVNVYVCIYIWVYTPNANVCIVLKQRLFLKSIKGSLSFIYQLGSTSYNFQTYLGWLGQCVVLSLNLRNNSIWQTFCKKRLLKSVEFNR